MLQWAHSTLLIKSIDDEQRIIEGVASSPTPDRDGDVIEPKGAVFTLPMPLLWLHKQEQPIGHVLAAQVKSDGIHIRAKIAKGVTTTIEEL